MAPTSDRTTSNLQRNSNKRGLLITDNWTVTNKISTTVDTPSVILVRVISNLIREGALAGTKKVNAIAKTNKTS